MGIGAGLEAPGVRPGGIELVPLPAGTVIQASIEPHRGRRQQFACAAIVDHSDVVYVGKFKTVIELFPGITTIFTTINTSFIIWSK